MRLWPWNEDADHFLANLPSRYIRPRDCYEAAARLRIDPAEVPYIWRVLIEKDLIVRTTHTIGRDPRKCYWERKRVNVCSPIVDNNSDRP
jgi:hypothetical protein